MTERPNTYELSHGAVDQLQGLASKLKVNEGEALARALNAALAGDTAKLTEGAPEHVVAKGNAAPRTVTWARLSSPFAWTLMGILAFTLIAPFVFISAVAGLSPELRVEKLLTWATHVLAPVIGVASAVVTYFFGRGAGDGNSRQ